MNLIKEGKVLGDHAAFGLAVEFEKRGHIMHIFSYGYIQESNPMRSIFIPLEIPDGDVF